MKHIEVSRKINLAHDVKPEEFKRTLIEHLEKTIEIESLSDDSHDYNVKGTTGSPAGITRHARVNLNVKTDFDSKEKSARIIVSGFARTARSLVILYSFAFFILLLVGLLPGFVSTNAEDSSAIDALFFLIFGIFIVFDVNNKLTEPRNNIETALESLNTIYG